MPGKTYRLRIARGGAPSPGEALRPDKPPSPIQRAVALAIVLMLLIGFANSTFATIAAYRILFQKPVASGRAATIDADVARLLVVGEDIRDAVKRAGWADDDVVLLMAASAIHSENEWFVHRIFPAASYLLYPRPVWLEKWCDPAASQAECQALGAASDAAALVRHHQARYVLLVSRSNPFPGARSQPLSDRLTIVELR